MTKQQLSKIPFKFIFHLSMEHEHCTTYEAVLPSMTLGMCIHQPYKDGVPKGRSYTHYRLNGEVYKSVDKLLQAINELEKSHKSQKTNTFPKNIWHFRRISYICSVITFLFEADGSLLNQ